MLANLGWVVGLVVGLIAAVTWAQSGPAKVRMILDTDLASDCDDAGAMAMLHAMADQGEVEILGVMISTGGPYSAPAANAINAWYGRADIPIGQLKQSDFWAGGSPDKPSGSRNYNRYTQPIAERYKPAIGSGDDAPDATRLYRQILAREADGSVTVCSIGALINLRRLLESSPDDASPLDGAALAKAKIKQLVVCGGKCPSGTSSNFSKDGTGPNTQFVLEKWPTPVVFVGNEVGGTFKTGWNADAGANAEHPARLAYVIYHNNDATAKRASWDQAGVLFAVRGTGPWYDLVENGHMLSDEKGNNRWVDKPAEGKRHAYVAKKAGEETDRTLAQVIESLMNAPPLARSVGQKR